MFVARLPQERLGGSGGLTRDQLWEMIQNNPCLGQRTIDSDLIAMAPNLSFEVERQATEKMRRGEGAILSSSLLIANKS